jgi:hypothetical protein
MHFQSTYCSNRDNNIWFQTGSSSFDMDEFSNPLFKKNNTNKYVTQLYAIQIKQNTNFKIKNLYLLQIVLL